jgi:thioredoxin-like negative regulator of GroEL
MNSIPKVAADSFDGLVLHSELPVLVLFCADDEAAGQCLLRWPGKWALRASSRLSIVQVPHRDAVSLAARCGIPAVPSLALFHRGSVCYQFCGVFSPREMEEVLARARALGAVKRKASCDGPIVEPPLVGDGEP